MVGHRRTPGMQHVGHTNPGQPWPTLADPGLEMLWVTGDRQHRFGRRIEDRIVDNGLIVERDVGDPRWQLMQKKKLSTLRRLLNVGAPMPLCDMSS
jgi:hypothetical protein